MEVYLIPFFLEKHIYKTFNIDIVLYSKKCIKYYIIMINAVLDLNFVIPFRTK